jgi:hypothetical protein
VVPPEVEAEFQAKLDAYIRDFEKSLVRHAALFEKTGGPTLEFTVEPAGDTHYNTPEEHTAATNRKRLKGKVAPRRRIGPLPVSKAAKEGHETKIKPQ